jgi:protein ImuB
MVPHIRVVEADESADAQLLEAIADWCDRFTPYVALDPPHGLLLDVAGAAHLFGGERAMLDVLQAGLRKQGFAIQAALAGTAGAARALSHFAANSIAPPGLEAEAVAMLPAGALDCDASIAQALRKAGLKTIGHVAQRQRAELASRFGKALVLALEQALGRGDRPISPRRPLPDVMVEHRFAEPIVTEEVILATLHALAGSLSSVLEERGQGARRLEALFFRADGVLRRITIETGAPTRKPEIITRLFQTKLDALADPIDPGFGFDLIRLEAILAQETRPEAISLGQDHRDSREIAQLIDQLSTRFGATRVLRFRPQDTHIPEAECVAVPAQYDLGPHSSLDAKRSAADAPQRPLRLLAKPEPISVMAEIPDGPPLRFRWRKVLHKAVYAAGPEAIAMEWWRNQTSQPTRDYFRIEDEEGRRYWLFREGEYRSTGFEPRWFMHGFFA